MTVVNPPGTSRRVVGAVRLFAGVALFVVIAIQIGDRVANNAFSPGEYFSYFTIQTSLINIVVFVVGGWMALTRAEDTKLYTAVRMTTVAFALITAGVYNLLLRNVPYTGDFAGLQWPNEVIHVWVPLLILLDWLLSRGRPRLPWRTLPVMLVYPVLWLAFTFIRGGIVAAAGTPVFGTQYYPYPFLDPTNGGWGSVLAYVGALTAFILLIGALAILWTRVTRSSRGSQVEAVDPSL